MSTQQKPPVVTLADFRHVFYIQTADSMQSCFNIDWLRCVKEDYVVRIGTEIISFQDIANADIYIQDSLIRQKKLKLTFKHDIVIGDIIKLMEHVLRSQMVFRFSYINGKFKGAVETDEWDKPFVEICSAEIEHETIEGVMRGCLGNALEDLPISYLIDHKQITSEYKAKGRHCHV